MPIRKAHLSERQINSGYRLQTNYHMNQSQNQLTSHMISKNIKIPIQQQKSLLPSTVPNPNQNMLKNMKVKFIINSLIKKIRYLSPPHHVPENIKQEWQLSINQSNQQQVQTKQQYSKQTLSEQLSHSYQIYRHLNLFEGILIVLFCWMITVSVVFQVKVGYEVFWITLVISLIKLLFLLIMWMKKMDNLPEQDKLQSFIQMFFEDLVRPVMMFVTSFLFLLRCKWQLSYFTYIIQIIGILTVILQYRHIDSNFQNVVRYAQHNKMKKQLRIIQLLLLIITLAHFFGLIMYAIHYIPVDGTNWLKKIQIDQKQWYIQYIYCFYWAITTMVTVGYGDITPANHYQVVVVMCIELIGTAVFGYMINVIGITVDQIKKKNQEFQNYQETIDKLRDHYQLSRELCHKMKYDIKQKENQFKNIPLKTSQQKDFLQYIQPNLKQQFVLQTNMKVIKKSIFFLTHFSVNFQNQIALKLIRIIYKPDQQIQIFDSQLQQRNLVIINNGSADIYIQSHHNNISLIKKVREITPSQDSLVMNVFGYSSLIVNRNIRLKAVAKQAAVTYVLRRKDILECMDKSMLDFQSFNQLRQKMTFYRMLEEVQAPSLKQNEKHFIPNIFLIQKKITYENQSRLQYVRGNLRTRLRLITCKNYGNKTIPKINDDIGQLDHHMMFIQDQEIKSFQSFQSNRTQFNHVFKDQLTRQTIRMDHCKVFENYMKGSNLPIVAAAYEKSCQKKTYRRRFRTSLVSKNKLKSSNFKDLMKNEELQ